MIVINLDNGNELKFLEVKTNIRERGKIIKSKYIFVIN